MSIKTQKIKDITDQKPQNIFLIAESLQKTYEGFVRSFQQFQNPKIQQWVNEQMKKEDLLYKDPLIELNLQFRKGKPLTDMSKEGFLHQGISKTLYNNITPYQHQSQAIELVLKEEKNIIVSTGTGSGKSLCYWIPILSTCLEMKDKGLDGIKAIVIFPMNALANSQYNSLVETLKDHTKLKVGRYTGDTAYSKKEGQKLLEERTGRDPFVCEYSSREEMQENPPDILITNYVMLDLILMRHDDKKLFPEKHKKYLKYLVLDEIHTYNGNSGSDVAALIRRLKEKTNTIGKLRCIGTSATIQDNKKNPSEGQPSSIVEFAQKIFGEKFDENCLITAKHVESDVTYDKIIPLPPDITFEEKDQQLLDDFDGTLKTVLPLAEKLLARPLTEEESQDVFTLGNLFKYQQTILFLLEQLEGSAKSLKNLSQSYKKKFRENSDEENCLRELKAAFLIGTVAKISKNQEIRPLLVPKLHQFFTRGHDIHSSLTTKGPFLSINGDLICKITNYKTYPMYFCRNCGHEFYSVIISEDNMVYPRNIEEEQPGQLYYLTNKTNENSNWELPEQWLNTKGEIKKTYKNAPPIETDYCPKHNTIESTCGCPESFTVWKIRYPFQLCPSCNIFYTKRKGEYGKLFTFNSTGRSSTTDVLTSRLLSSLSEDQKKLIVFTDNRQDTALQAEHMNEFQRRLNFRQTMYGTLQMIRDESLRVSDREIGEKLYQYLEQNNLLPDFSLEGEDKYSTASPPVKEYKEFLTFLAISDIMQSFYFLDINLDKLGLLNIEYDGLDVLSTDDPVYNKGFLQNYSDIERFDYLKGILDIFRWNGAIGNTIFNNSANRSQEWKNKITNDLLFDINKSFFSNIGFTFEIPKNEITGNRRKVFFNNYKVNLKSIAGNNSVLVNWTNKYFGLNDSKKAKKIITQTIKILEKTGFIKQFWSDNRGPKADFYQIKDGKMLFKLNENNTYNRCPKCQRVYFFKQYDKCIWRNCPTLELSPINEDNYYLKLYKKGLDRTSEIHAKEHSAQVNGNLREKFEDQFKESSPDSLNVLVCTPTMELGIDIGDLSSIIMRNVPPDPSRYAQRAGRAGRKNQPSIICVFCGTGYAKGPHDQYFYRQPELIVSGKIEPPNFLLDNRKLLQRHIHSKIFESLDTKISQKLGDIWDLTDVNSEPPFPMKENVRKNLQDEIIGKKLELIEIISRCFAHEMDAFDYWFDENFIQTTIEMFIPTMDKVFNSFRDDYLLIQQEMDFLHQQSKAGSSQYKETSKYMSLQSKVNKIKEGKIPYTTFSYLSNYGFIPNYGFPSSSSMVSLYNLDTKKSEDVWRSSVIAIREFAPYNQIYFLGDKYQIKRAEIKTTQGKIDIQNMYICPHCEEITVDSSSLRVKSLSNCPNCEEIIDTSQYKEAFEFPHMSSVNKEKISCDEENRMVKGYEVSMNYKQTLKSVKYDLKKSSVSEPLGKLSYENNGKIFIVNKGTVLRDKDNPNEAKIEPFYYCSACGNWLHESKVKTHIDICDRDATSQNIYSEGYWLFVEGNHDVLDIRLPMLGNSEPSKKDIMTYYTTLKETIVQSILLTFNLDESEILGFLRTVPGSPEYSIIIFEKEEGGTGVIKSLLDPEITRFDSFIENIIKILHIKTLKPFKHTSDACKKACYNCLLRFRNQFEHEYLDRNSILPLISKLKDIEIEKKEKQIDSPMDHLKYLKEKCDSELEKLVLEEIQRQKLPLPTDAQKSEFDGDVPIVKADFFYEPKTFVFVDGPPHEDQSIQDSDLSKREYLESIAKIVVELDFKDGKYKNNPSLIEEEVKKLRDYLI